MIPSQACAAYVYKLSASIGTMLLRHMLLDPGSEAFQEYNWG